MSENLENMKKSSDAIAGIIKNVAIIFGTLATFLVSASTFLQPITTALLTPVIKPIVQDVVSSDTTELSKITSLIDEKYKEREKTSNNRLNQYLEHELPVLVGIKLDSSFNVFKREFDVHVVDVFNRETEKKQQNMWITVRDGVSYKIEGYQYYIPDMYRPNGYFLMDFTVEEYEELKKQGKIK